LRTGYWRAADPAAEFCDGFVIRSITDELDPVAEASLDALEPSLVNGASILCLPLPRAESDHVGSLLEGLILLPSNEGYYRRIGFFSGCQDVDWFDKRELYYRTVI
jgi:hypothetical protein